MFSVTSSAPHLFGSRVGEFESELRGMLRHTSPDGRFCEVAPPGQLIIWTRPLDIGLQSLPGPEQESREDPPSTTGRNGFQSARFCRLARELRED